MLASPRRAGLPSAASRAASRVTSAPSAMICIGTSAASDSAAAMARSRPAGSSPAGDRSAEITRP